MRFVGIKATSNCDFFFLLQIRAFQYVNWNIDVGNEVGIDIEAQLRLGGECGNTNHVEKSSYRPVAAILCLSAQVTYLPNCVGHAVDG